MWRGGVLDNTDSLIPNKSFNRHEVYQDENMMDDKKFHFSIDDTILCFKDLTENEYNSIFENTTFAWLKELHEKYGIVVSCFCYYSTGDFNLSKVSSRYQKEFLSNSSWLRFGFHTVNANTTYDSAVLIDDYLLTVSELERIVGSDSIDNFIRLQSYQGNINNIISIKQSSIQPIVGLLTADDVRQSYYLDGQANKYIYCHDKYFDERLNIQFISTDIRVEYVENVSKKLKEFETDAWNNQLGFLEVFTHEWTLNIDIKEKVEKFCKWAYLNDYSFEFPEDNIY